MSMAAVPEQLPPAAELNIRDYLDVIRRRKTVFIHAFVLVLAVGVVATLLTKPVYRTQAKLLVSAPPPNVNLLDVNNPLAQLLVQANPDTIPTQMQDLQSSEFLREARQRADIRPRPGVVPPSVRVENIQNTQVIQITVEGGHPQDIARYANAIVDLHLERMRRQTTEGLERAIARVSEEKDKAARRLAQAEKKLLDFRLAHRTEELAGQKDVRAREYAALVERMEAAESRLITARAQLTQLQQQLKATPETIPQDTTKENPRIARLQERLDQLLFRRTELEQLYNPGSRPLQDLDEQIAKLKAELEREPREVPVPGRIPNPMRAALLTKLAELQSSLLGYESDYRAAVAQVEAAKAQANDLAPWEIELDRLTGERETAKTNYNQLAERLRDLQIRSNANILPARPIERAGVPTVPVHPRKAVNIALSALLALFVAAGLAFLQEYLDDRVNSPEDVERLTPLPTLGHVPSMPAEQPRLLTTLSANSHVAEAYRALRSSIGFAGIDAPIRRLQVTSPSKGEGKSTTSVNLATAMAMDGKRVVLVDADLRRPSVHRLFNIPNSPGLSEVLAGMKSIDEVLQNTEIENLRVVTSGPIPPNPAELLGSRTFDQVIERLEQIADVVIVDTPPCIPVTDPLIVAARMDGVVLVLHAGQTRKAAVKHAIELLARARARILGMVYNRVQTSRSGSYYYHYYYYYGDGYYSEGTHRTDRRNGRRRKSLTSGKALASRNQEESETS